MTRLATLLLACSVAAPLTAQAHPLEGKWNLEYPAGARVGPNGTEAIMGKAAFEVVAKGDSLIATLTPGSVEGQPARPPSRLAAIKRAGEVTFSVTSKSQMHFNGEQRDVTVRSTWILTANGDALSGTVSRLFEGAEDLPIPQNEPQPVSGTRAK